MENSTTTDDQQNLTAAALPRNSKALQRVKKHSYMDIVIESDGTVKSVEKTRQEGIYLSLDQIMVLVGFLRLNHPKINHVGFMIGKKSATEGGRPLEGRQTSIGNEDELTVEILPFELRGNGSSELLQKLNLDGTVEIDGFLLIQPNMPFDNDANGGGGGNQKTPPPSVRTP